MAKILGADTVIAGDVAGTFGTAASLGTGDKMEVESLSQGLNPEELTANPIGSGQVMANDSQMGKTSPGGTVDKILAFNDAGTAASAVFWGGVSVVTQASTYAHSFTKCETFNSKWFTLATQYALSSVMEFASCAITAERYSYREPPDYSKHSFDFLGNDRKTASTTNTFAALETATVADSERVVLQVDDEFRIDVLSASALATGHKRSVKAVEIEYLAPQEHTREIRGSGATGNGQPIPSGSPPFECNVTVEFTSLDDVTFFAALEAGTEFQASLTITGSIITGAINKKITHYFPRLKIVTDPDYQLSSAGINPLTVRFKALTASTVPSGMIAASSGGTMPHIVIVNGRSTSYFA
jgi:hypothetical protein